MTINISFSLIIMNFILHLIFTHGTLCSNVWKWSNWCGNFSLKTGASCFSWFPTACHLTKLVYSLRVKFVQSVTKFFVTKLWNNPWYSPLILSRFRGCYVTNKTGFGLDDWIYWHLIYITRDYRQYSAIADLHTLQFTVTHALEFSVFTSRILATDF
jgi:hypothetical protein